MKKLPLLILVSCLILSTYAQDKTIRGVVTTFDSIYVAGAEVKIISTKEIIKTDSLGRFSAQVNSKDKLKVFANGFYTQKVVLNENTKVAAINLKLKQGEKAREYAIGYGHVKDADKLNAVAQLSNSDVDFSHYTSMTDLIRGRIPGVTIMGNGDILIRGVNSINSDNAALIVVDGVVVDKSMIHSISPINVKSINVLKDGSAAIYGSRGANGVVIIETKRGGDQ